MTVWSRPTARDLYGAPLKCSVLLNLDRHLVNLAAEAVVAFLVGVGHVRGLIPAHVRPLVALEDQGNGVGDTAFRGPLPVDRERRRSALAEAAAVIGEIEPDRRLARCHRLRRGHRVALAPDPVVDVLRLAALEVEAPAGEAPGLRGDPAVPSARPGPGAGR